MAVHPKPKKRLATTATQRREAHEVAKREPGGSLSRRTRMAHTAEQARKKLLASLPGRKSGRGTRPRRTLRPKGR